MRLALFDLDHTLLSGDSDVLWCEFLMQEGLLERSTFGPRNAAMERDYQAGTVSTEAFCSFYVSTLAGRTPQQWLPWRQRFLEREIIPRIPDVAMQQVRTHHTAGDTVVLTTATNRLLTELTAKFLGIEHLIATECEVDAHGVCTGRTQGVINMREGKVQRLEDWLALRGTRLADVESVSYSDSVNDVPLLSATGRAVAVDPDAKLAAVAAQRGWQVLRWRA